MLGIYYQPPSSNVTFVSGLYDTLNTVLMRYPNADATLLGNFNYPNVGVVSWCSFCQTIFFQNAQFYSFLFGV